MTVSLHTDFTWRSHVPAWFERVALHAKEPSQTLDRGHRRRERRVRHGRRAHRRGPRQAGNVDELPGQQRPHRAAALPGRPLRRRDRLGRGARHRRDHRDRARGAQPQGPGLRGLRAAQADGGELRDRAVRLPRGGLELPQLRRDDRRDQQRGRRVPEPDLQAGHRQVLREPRHHRAQDQRQRRGRRGRAGGAVHAPPARP